MKINRLEAHDRLKHFKKDQEANIFQGAEDCLKKNEDSIFYQERSPYVYIFAHPRTADDGVTKRMLWQPRLLKPKCESNSYLFRAVSHTDNIEVIWMIPAMEMWSQYKTGNVTEHEIVNWSIDQYLTNKKFMEKRDVEDLPEEKCKQLLKELIEFKRSRRQVKQLISEEFLTSS